jgi:hypothetical protein
MDIIAVGDVQVSMEGKAETRKEEERSRKDIVFKHTQSGPLRRLVVTTRRNKSFIRIAYIHTAHTHLLIFRQSYHCAKYMNSTFSAYLHTAWKRSIMDNMIID